MEIRAVFTVPTYATEYGLHRTVPISVMKLPAALATTWLQVINYFYYYLSIIYYTLLHDNATSLNRFYPEKLTGSS